MNEAPNDVASSASRMGATLLAMVHTRVELAAVEVAQERLRLAHQALAATLTLFAAGVGLVLTVLAVAWLAGPEHAAKVLAGSALSMIVLAIAMAWVWRALVRSRPSLLASTLEQLRADARMLAARGGGDVA
jgi:uncharacterized membrane protein YqjE